MIDSTGVFLVTLIGSVVVWFVVMDILQVRRERKRRKERQQEQRRAMEGQQRTIPTGGIGGFISGVNFADYGQHMITRDASRREIVSAIQGPTGWNMHCNSCGRGWKIHDTDRRRARAAALNHTSDCLIRTTNIDEKPAATP